MSSPAYTIEPILRPSGGGGVRGSGGGGGDSAMVLDGSDDGAFVAQGFTCVVRDKDGCIYKLRLKEGTSKHSPKHLCHASVHFVGRRLEGEVVHSTRDLVEGKFVGGDDTPEEVHLMVATLDAQWRTVRGDSRKYCRGFHQGVVSMRTGEVSKFVFTGKYAYQPGDESPPKAGYGEALMYEVELVSWRGATPPVPPRDVVEAREKKRKDEERRQLEEHPPPPPEERVRMANEAREEGNAALKAGDAAQARKCYDRGFVSLFLSREEVDAGLVSKDDEAKLHDAMLPLYLNRALANLRLGRLEPALWDTEQALAIRPGDQKALFRRGVARLRSIQQEAGKQSSGEYWDPEKCMEELVEAKADLEHVQKINPADAKIKLQMESCVKTENYLMKTIAKREAAVAKSLKGKFQAKDAAKGGGAESTSGADGEEGADDGDKSAAEGDKSAAEGDEESDEDDDGPPGLEY